MRRSLAAILTFVLVPVSVQAQALVGFGNPVTQSDLLYFAGEAEPAYDLLIDYLQSNPADYGALWRVARAGVVVGLGKNDNRAQNLHLDPALHFAGLAVELEPDGIDGLYWRGVAAGRRAMNAAPGYSVELAQIVYDDAHAILEADSLHAGAHNMLGKLNFEVMSLSRFRRAIARMLMGNDAIKDTSWEKAEIHLTKAVEVSPDFVLYQFDLGQLHEKRGRDVEAAAYLEEAVRLPAVQPIDPLVQEMAASLLQEITR